jgi:hypothetical protein
VIWTSGDIDKLAIYQRLGIDEVWFWIAGGRLEVHSLRGDRYDCMARSRGLPGLDLDLMCTFLDRRSVHIARRDSARRCEPRRNVGYRRARRCWTVSVARDQLAHRTGSQHG